MSESVVLLGAGGHARSLIELLNSCRMEIEGVYDDSFQPGGREMIGSYLLAGSVSALPAGKPIVLAIGDNSQREQMFQRFRGEIVQKNLLHRSAYCAMDVDLGIANQLFANVFVNAQARIGDNNIVNSGAIIEHETEIGSHNHVSVGAVLCGRVAIGDHCMIGAGSVVIDKISICDQVIIGANSTVVSSIEQPGVYVGSPARRVK